MMNNDDESNGFFEFCYGITASRHGLRLDSAKGKSDVERTPVDESKDFPPQIASERPMRARPAPGSGIPAPEARRQIAVPYST